jgi:type II secretory pathway pseudopilin PulG
MRHTYTYRSAFTLIELTLVVGVILILMAGMVAALGGLTARNKEEATRNVIGTVTASIANRGSTVITLSDGSLTDYGNFDRDSEGVLDGDPKGDPTFARTSDVPGKTWAEVAADSKYEGIVPNLPFSVPTAHFDKKTGRVVDAWRKELRIVYDAVEYGPEGFRIFSAGPDGVFGNDDDVYAENYPK